MKKKLKLNKKDIIPVSKPYVSKKNIFAINKVLKSGWISSNGAELKKFENKFSNLVERKYSTTVANGTAALEIAIKALGIKKNDEVLIPNFTIISNAIAVLRQAAKPVLIDCNLENWNIKIEDIEKKITKKTKAIMLINVLGISSDLFKIKKIAKRNKLLIFEDNCESLGTKLKNKYLGTFGDYASFSFYYSHQITSGEGGMITCDNDKDYEILFSLRSHGWFGGTRFYTRKFKTYNTYAKKYPKLDPRYIFSNSGFNLRPTDIQAAIAHNQFKRLDKLKKMRNINRNLIINKIKKSKFWNNQFNFINPNKDFDPSWMGLPILINEKFRFKKSTFINYLDQAGIETRPIISGSFVNQPAVKLYELNKKNEKFKVAQKVQDLGFLIGLHTNKISERKLKLIHDTFFGIDKI